tara:strand:- start:145 stop:405 length:261 start_codon:yes stop_codon:yes gene_type:complete
MNKKDEKKQKMIQKLKHSYKRLNNEDIYSKEDIFIEWGISNSKLYEIVKSLSIKPVKLGKMNLYRGKDLNIYYDKLFNWFSEDRTP